MVFMLRSGLAAAALIAHACLTKASMTILFRLKLTMKSTPKAEVDKILASTFYKRWSSTQLNEAEWASLLVGALLFLSSKGVDAPIASTLAAVGQIGYFWCRGLIGHYHEGGVDPPPYVPAALMRYAGLGMLAFEVYKIVA